MPEQRSPLKEFRHLAEKLATVGLSPAEQARYLQLKEIVAPEPAAARPGFDVNAAAEALKASLEPAGLRRPARAPAEPGLPDLGAPPSGAGAPPVDAGSPGYDPAAPAWDPNQPYDPNAQPYDAGVQASDAAAQAWDPNQPYDPGAPAWDPNAPPADPSVQGYDPGAQAGDAAAQAWDPNQPYDPGAPAWDPNAPPADPSAQGYDPGAQPWDPNQPYDPSAPNGYAAAQPDAVDLGAGGAPGLDPGSGALNQGPVDAGTGAPAWDPAAAGSYDQAAWDAGSASPPVDPDAALDPTAPPLDATGAGEAQAGWDAAAGAPAVRPYDLGPEAFDAAALPPPEPGPASYDQAGWDAAAAGTVPPESAAGPPPEGEPIEAELVDAELIEAEPSPEAPAPGSYLAPGPLAPDFAGAQPLAAGWPEAEAPAGEGQQEQADAGFEPAEPGGPGAVEVGAPAAIDLGPVEEAAGTAAEAVPLASPSEFLSSFEPPPAPPADALDGEVAIEELPPVEMDVEEIAERPPPGAPQAPAPSIGGPAASFVAGEHRVVVHTLEGQVLRGTIADVDLDAATIPLVAGAGAAAAIDASRVKAVFFMLLPGGRPPAPEGRKVRVTFRDGRQVAGFSADYDPEAVGFFMVPADSRTNTGRIWVYRAAVRQVSVT